jgi:hypothetical protein
MADDEDWDKSGETVYLNVDAEVFAKDSLDVLVAAFKDRIHVNHVGREAGRFSAHFSLGSHRHSASPNLAIRQYVRLIERLPKPARRVWSQAQSRAFNIGIQGGTRPRSKEVHIDASTVAVAARVGAAILVTVYGSEPAAARRRSRLTARLTPTGRKRPAG